MAARVNQPIHTGHSGPAWWQASESRGARDLLSGEEAEELFSRQVGFHAPPRSWHEWSHIAAQASWNRRVRPANVSYDFLIGAGPNKVHATRLGRGNGARPGVRCGVSGRKVRFPETNPGPGRPVLQVRPLPPDGVREAS